MIGWKCARAGKGLALVKLSIEGIVIRGTELGPKMRTSQAKVLEINKIIVKKTKGKYGRCSHGVRWWFRGCELDKSLRKVGNKIKSAFSDNDRVFVYKVGDTVQPSFEFDATMRTCASGIHFFLNKRDAMRYLDS